jgi:hypothetical protein
MTRSGGKSPGWSGVRRVALGVALAALIQGCGAGFGLPRLRPGSNVSLPQPLPNALVDLLLGNCEAPTGSPQSSVHDMIDCTGRGAATQTTPDPRPVGSPKAP